MIVESTGHVSAQQVLAIFLLIFIELLVFSLFSRTFLEPYR